MPSPRALPRRRQCATMHVHYRVCDLYPQFRVNQARLERFTAKRMSASAPRRRKPSVIPVVVHVVYNEPSENISAAQVRSQIRVLNDDFRAKNTDLEKIPDVWRPLATDAWVEFRLATRDPQGQPSSGITRHQTDRPAFAPDDSVKSSREGGVQAWPANRYLNIWVCTLRDGLLGYAQFPGGPWRTDGVVVLNTAFGTEGSAAAPFDQGRTTTHEVGHYLNLRHIWGDINACSGSDSVVDTPPQELPNYGEPSYPHLSCNNGPHGDMFMNYMDYVDDAAMFMFTAGQIERMRAALEGPRRSLLAQKAARPRPSRSRATTRRR